MHLSDLRVRRAPRIELSNGQPASAALKRMHWRRTTTSLAAALALLLTASRASATDVCIVQSSSDGFVALRAKPSTDGVLLVRAKFGEAVVIQKNSAGDQIVSGQWLRVMHFPDSVVPTKSDPKYKRGKVGWMHKRFIDECG